MNSFLLEKEHFHSNHFFEIQKEY